MPLAARSALGVPQLIATPGATIQPQALSDPWKAPAVQTARNPFLILSTPAPARQSAPPAVVVRATLLGTTPHALIEVGGITHIVAAGQSIGAITIARIDARGIWLTSGLFLPLQSEGP